MAEAGAVEGRPKEPLKDNIQASANTALDIYQSLKGRDLKAEFETLSENAYLDVIVPRLSNIETQTLLGNGSPGDVLQLASRRNLFFDEQANILLVLKTESSTDAAQELLPCLEIVLAGHATDAVPQGTGNAASASGKHDLTFKTIPATSDAHIVSYDDQTYILWNPSLHVSRPRVRLQRPAIYFTASVTLSARALSASRMPATDYLKPFELLPENVLDPLNFAPGMSKDKRVYLSADRLTKVAPQAPRSEASVKPMRGATKRAFPAIPALFMRIRYSSLPDSIIASLHIETPHVVTGTISIQDVKVELVDEKKGKVLLGPEVPTMTPSVQDMGAFSWPTETKAGDEIVALFKLTPGKYPKERSVMDGLSVSIKATAILDQSSEIPLDIRWQAQVDMSQARAKPTYRWSRPLSADSLHYMPPFASTVPRSEPTEKTSSHGTDTTGILCSFTAGPTVVTGEIFRLHIHCINNSSRVRRFIITSLQSKGPRITAHQKQSSKDTADLVANIFNVPPLQHHKQSEVQLLTPVVHVGPLPPFAVSEMSMSFKAVATGALDLGVIRIFDVDTRQIADIKELPDVIALEPTYKESTTNSRKPEAID